MHVVVPTNPHRYEAEFSLNQKSNTVYYIFVHTDIMFMFRTALISGNQNVLGVNVNVLVPMATPETTAVNAGLLVDYDDDNTD